jgi:hypothetical protein
MGLNDYEDGVARRAAFRRDLRTKVEAVTLARTVTPQGHAAHLVPPDVFDEIESGLVPGARWLEGGLEQMDHLSLAAMGLVIVKAWPVGDRDRWG